MLMLVQNLLPCVRYLCSHAAVILRDLESFFDFFHRIALFSFI